jgi:L-ascorbate metabolism protein UlaG (beta-lactamase superfamily)
MTRRHERWALRRDVSLAVLAKAKTERDHHEDLGCSILGPGTRRIRDAHRVLKLRVQQLGERAAIRDAKRLVADLESTSAYARLTTGKRRLGRLLLKNEVLFPSPNRTPPKFLHVRREQVGFDVEVAGHQWAAVADVCAALARGLSAQERVFFRRLKPCRTLLDTLWEARWVEPTDGPVDAPSAGFIFVGHHTSLLRDGGTSTLIDPYFRPSSHLDLPGYAPLHARDLGPIDAVCITHSHGDHFHLGSLLTLPRDTAIFLPKVERESLFSTDCAERLRQLGFTRIHEAPWHSSHRVGAQVIQVLPFYGEQPTSGEGVYEGLFNEGATYVVRGPQVSGAFLADSGADRRGSMRTVCDLARRGGAVDVLFCGVRGFRLRPIFFSFTTLDAFLVNVPMHALTRQEQLMADPVEALDLGRRLGATTLVPCADGGAPWYWREGMGPKYPGYPGHPVEGASWHEENPNADPYPERVATFRKKGDPLVTVLRPGEALAGLKTLRFRRAQWPFEPLATHADRS